VRRSKEKKIGASEGIRTLDTHVGNVMLYQAELRSLPKTFGEIKRIVRVCKFCFLTGLFNLELMV
jgi:hypothetical protein